MKQLFVFLLFISVLLPSWGEVYTSTPSVADKACVYWYDAPENEYAFFAYTEKSLNTAPKAFIEAHAAYFGGYSDTDPLTADGYGIDIQTAIILCCYGGKLMDNPEHDAPLSAMTMPWIAFREERRFFTKGTISWDGNNILTVKRGANTWVFSNEDLPKERGRIIPRCSDAEGEILWHLEVIEDTVRVRIECIRFALD